MCNILPQQVTVYYKFPPLLLRRKSFQVEKCEMFCSKAFTQGKQTAQTAAATQPVALVVFIAAIPGPSKHQVAVLR
jgi:hypothetical protein